MSNCGINYSYVSVLPRGLNRNDHILVKTVGCLQQNLGNLNIGKTELLYLTNKN